MATTFSVDGYVKTVKVFPAGNFKKAYVSVSSLRKRLNKNGEKQYDTVNFQCFVFDEIPSFEEGSYIVASGEVQSYKDQNDVWQQILFADSVGVDPGKYREPKPKAEGSAAPQPRQTNGGYSRQSAPQSAPAQSRPAPQPPRQTGFRRPAEEPKPVDPKTAEGPELFKDDNIPF